MDGWDELSLRLRTAPRNDAVAGRQAALDPFIWSAWWPNTLSFRMGAERMPRTLLA